MTEKRRFDAVVMGASAGGMAALKAALAPLPDHFPLPIAVVQHVSPDADDYIVRYLARVLSLRVKEADEKEKMRPGTVYLAPPNYHLLMEDDLTFSLSVDEKINFSRPSIDVLFETAAAALGPGLIAVLLTGANQDGSRGMKAVRQKGGVTVVQSPDTATTREMPEAALAATPVDYILPPEAVGPLLLKLAKKL